MPRLELGLRVGGGAGVLGRLLGKNKGKHRERSGRASASKASLYTRGS